MSTSMRTPEQKIRQRTAWFAEAERWGNVTLACKRCGISRKTYYKWHKRFAEARGDRQALLDRSHRPHRPRRPVKNTLRRRRLPLRQRTHLGPARLRALLVARGTTQVPSAATMAKIRKRAGLHPQTAGQAAARSLDVSRPPARRPRPA